MVYSPSPEESDILMVNTCGFIEEAKRESIEEILRIAGFKKKGVKTDQRRHPDKNAD